MTQVTPLRLVERRKPHSSKTTEQYLVVATGDLLAFAAAALLVYLTQGRAAGTAVPDFWTHLIQRSDHLLIVIAWLVWFMAVKQICVNRKPFGPNCSSL
jgi:predicted metal-binding membrane protein